MGREGSKPSQLLRLNSLAIDFLQWIDVHHSDWAIQEEDGVRHLAEQQTTDTRYPTMVTANIQWLQTVWKPNMNITNHLEKGQQWTFHICFRAYLCTEILSECLSTPSQPCTVCNPADQGKETTGQGLLCERERRQGNCFKSSMGA